jgi:SHS2 domain-containing protein
MPAVFEILEHTADIGFRASGATLPELLQNCAVALASFAESADAENLTREVEVSGEDNENLLVNWLSEVLYLMDAGIVMPARFQVDQPVEGRLHARVFGQAGPVRWRLIVKAVTYHQIEVAERNGCWEATVYLDV